MKFTPEQVIEWAKEARLPDAIAAHPGVKHALALAMSAGRDQGLREAKEVAANKSQSVIACNTSRSTKRTNQTALFAAGLLDDCATAIEQLRGK